MLHREMNPLNDPVLQLYEWCNPRRKVGWSDRWIPLVDFSVGAGGADGRHYNVQPYDFMDLCPHSVAVNSNK